MYGNDATREAPREGGFELKYFCRVRLESGRDSETTLFLILDAADGKAPQSD